jgi:hypothetical protein
MVEFEGRVLEQSEYGAGSRNVVFAVQGKVSGPLENRSEALTVRITWGGGGNCGFSGRPAEAGEIYRIRSYIGQSATGQPLLFANTCGGALELLSAPDRPPVTFPGGGGGRDRNAAVPYGLAAVGAAGICAAVAVVVRWRLRRSVRR